jgi:hypothetical protein
MYGTRYLYFQRTVVCRRASSELFALGGCLRSPHAAPLANLFSISRIIDK